MRSLADAARRVPAQMSAPVRQALIRAVQRTNRGLPGRRVRWGDIARRAPFSSVYGWDRGLPVDRFYIEAFLRRHERLITGSVLEVRSALYASRFGSAERVTVLDVDPDNPEADITADLNVQGCLPEAAYDSVILTQVLQYTDPPAALDNIVRSLRPGGTALVTVPCLGRIDPEAVTNDLWRWTPAGFRQVLKSVGVRAEVQGHGNALAAAAVMLGLSAEEIPHGRLGEEDASFPVVACAVVRPSDVC